LSGSLIPPLVNVYLPKFNLNERYGFRFFNGLAAGLVLAVGYIHSIPDSIQSFGEAFPENNQTAQYAWGGLCAMIGSLATFFAEEYVHRNIGRFAVVHGHHHHSHPHHHHHHGDGHGKTPDDIRELENNLAAERKSGDSDEAVVTDKGTADPDKVAVEMSEKELPINKAETVALEAGTPDRATAIATAELGYYTELYVLLFGLSFHSIFVGIALGVSGNDWGLFAAIVFHQFFEGMALGARVARAGFRSKLHIWFLDLIYALSAPIGIAIGIGIEAAISGNNVTYNAVNGIFQGLSSGILIYVSLIHMMKEEMERPEFQKGGNLLFIMYFGFLIGAGCMAVIGIWA